MPRLTLFVPGTPATATAWRKALAKQQLTWRGDALRGAPAGTQVEFIENDGTFAQAFAFSPVTARQREAIDAAGSALVLTFEPPLQAMQAELCRVLRGLERAGALAVRVEQSRLGWAIADWRAHLESGDPRRHYLLAVVSLTGGGETRSVGMHVFALPDAQVALRGEAADALLSAFNVFQLAEDPVLLTGHTFTPEVGRPRRLLERWPDGDAPQDAPGHNPFGVWRLGKAGARKAPLSPAQAFVFMPALAVLLTAAEAKARRRLTRREVEALVGRATCVAMDHRDAQALERSRGYADLDPERAWAQWQLLR